MRIQFERHVDHPSTRRCWGLLALTLALILAQQFTGAHDGLAEQIAGLTAQLVKNPANAELLVRRAELYRFTRQWNQAHADLDRARTVDPTLTVVDLARAHLFFDAGNQQQAVDAATRFLTKQPGHVDALIVRGRAHARLGAARNAANDFTQALEQRPVPDLYIERARTFLAAHDIQGALGGLDDGIDRLGPLVTLELEAIELELRWKRYDAALARLGRVPVPAARQDSWLRRRGVILEQAGRIAEARAAYDAALTAALNLPESIRRTRAASALIERLRADLTRTGRAPKLHPQKR